MLPGGTLTEADGVLAPSTEAGPQQRSLWSVQAGKGASTEEGGSERLDSLVLKNTSS